MIYYLLTLVLTTPGRSSVYRWPGHLAFPEKPAYYENSSHVDGKNFTLAREAIEETFQHLREDPLLNFMVVYLDQPDPVGHQYGVNSTEVCRGVAFEIDNNYSSQL